MFHRCIGNTAAEVEQNCPMGSDFAAPQYAGNWRKVMHRPC
jgi:hypothetical protein